MLSRSRLSTGVILVCFQIGRAADFTTIERAWQHRMEVSRTSIIKWSESRINRPIDPENQQPLGDMPQQVPELAIYLDRGKARFDDCLINSKRDELLKRAIAAYNGASSRTLSPDNEHPWGVIYPHKRLNCSGRMTAWPVLLLYRGMDSKLIDLTLDVFRNASVVPDQRPGYTTLRATGTARGRIALSKWELTLANDFDYAPVKLRGYHNGIPCFDLRIELMRNSSGEVVPVSWSVSMVTEKGVLLQAVRAKVTLCNLQATVDQSLFDLDFPNGTLVDDLRPRATGGFARQYVLVDGKEREIRKEELIRGASYEELIRTKPGEAGMVKVVPHQGRPVLLWINVLLVVGLATYALYRFLRRQLKEL
jgi:hypothetical protein